MSKQTNQQETVVLIHRVWSHSLAVKAVTYFRSLLRSLREHWLDIRLARMRLSLMDARPGRPDRRGLIQRDDIRQEAARAQQQFEETSHELLVLDVHCPDPASGLALIPFNCGADLAWLVVDLFAPEGLVGWRRHADSAEMWRPLASLPASAIRR